MNLQKVQSVETQEWMEIYLSVVLLLRHRFDFTYVIILIYIMGFTFVLKNLYFCQINNSRNAMYYGLATDIIEIAA